MTDLSASHILVAYLCFYGQGLISFVAIKWMSLAPIRTKDGLCFHYRLCWVRLTFEFVAKCSTFCLWVTNWPLCWRNSFAHLCHRYSPCHLPFYSIGFDWLQLVVFGLVLSILDSYSRGDLTCSWAYPQILHYRWCWSSIHPQSRHMLPDYLWKENLSFLNWNHPLTCNV